MLAPQNTLLNTRGKINYRQMKNPYFLALFGLDILVSSSSKLHVLH